MISALIEILGTCLEMAKTNFAELAFILLVLLMCVVMIVFKAILDKGGN